MLISDKTGFLPKQARRDRKDDEYSLKENSNRILYLQCTHIKVRNIQFHTRNTHILNYRLTPTW